MSSLLKSSLTYAPSIIVPRIFSYLIVIVFTRLLVPSEFGLYSLIITYGEVVDTVFMGWSRLGMLRFLRKDNDANKNGLIKANLQLYGVSIIAGVIGSAILSLTTIDATSPISFFVALTTYFIGNSAMRFGLTVLRASHKQKLYTTLEVIRPSISFGCIFLVIPFLGLSYDSLAFGFFGTTALIGIGTLLWTTRDCFSLPANWHIMKQMLKYALPLILVFFLSATIKATDRYMLNALSGTAMVGLYAASYSLSRPAIELLFNVINLGAFPQLVNQHDEIGTQAAITYLEQILMFQIYLGVPIVFGIAVLAEPVSNIMLGEAYRHGAPVLMPLIALTGLLAGLKSFAFDQVFHLKQRPMMLNYTLLFASILNIFLSYFFILSFGAYGAAWATLLSYLLALLLSIILSTRLIPVPFPVKESIIVLISSAVMWCCLSLILLTLQLRDIIQIIIGVPTGVVIFILVSFFLGSGTTKMLFNRIQT